MRGASAGADGRLTRGVLLFRVHPDSAGFGSAWPRVKIPFSARHDHSGVARGSDHARPAAQSPGQIEPIEDAAVGQPGEDPTQPASICPLDFSSRSRDDVLMSASGDGWRGRNAWLVAAAFVAVFGLGLGGGANWYRLSDFEAASNPVTQKVTYSRPVLESETKAAQTDGPVLKTSSTTCSLETPVA